MSLRALVKMVGAATVMVACFWCFGRLTRPPLPAGIKQPTPDEVRAAVAARDSALPLDAPLRIWRDVDYNEGQRAAWWPQGESPILAELVREGKLPPVAERVGPTGSLGSDHGKRFWLNDLTWFLAPEIRPYVFFLGVF